jgi:calmodulin
MEGLLKSAAQSITKSGTRDPKQESTADLIDTDDEYDENEEEYLEAFELFDKDGDGTISTNELKNLLRCFGHQKKDEEVQDLIK